MDQELEQAQPTGVKAHVCDFGVTFVPTFDVERSYEPDEGRMRRLLETLMGQERLS